MCATCPSVMNIVKHFKKLLFENGYYTNHVF